MNSEFNKYILEMNGLQKNKKKSKQVTFVSDYVVSVPLYRMCWKYTS